tara:strand:- start:13 stop:3051 length:3039 start_codon:yes stop_codon:yes gene_type:complete
LTIKSDFRLLDGKPKRVFGYDLKSATHRVEGDWRRTKPLSELDELRLQAVGGLLHALPGWPLADGIDRSKYTPDSHQLLVSDMLATNWFHDIEGLENFGRTRVLVADEGGTGKTLGVSLAVRWTTIQQDAKGPVLILVPPLLKEHWLDHLQAVFSDDPDRVQMLNSARFFDPIQHHNQIVIMSKFSWIYHWSGRENEITPLCVVIDEAHQGRTGMTLEENEEGGDEEGLGNIVDEEEIFTPTVQAKVLQQTCAKARFAIGVTATPINIHTKEIEYILAMLGSESQWKQDTNSINGEMNHEWQKSLAAVTTWARNANDATTSCPAELLMPLLTMLRDEQYPKQWNEFSQAEIDSLIHWFDSICDGSTTLTPSHALRRVRDLHPYGRHLSMVLRVDLIPRHVDEQQQFRIRKERTERLSIGEDILYFLSEIRRNDKVVGLLKTLNQSTRIVCSHRKNPKNTDESGEPRYCGTKEKPVTWDFTNQQSLGFWAHVQTMADPRIERLVDQIRVDLAHQDEGLPGRVTQRGCVIFTDWRGTIDSLKWEINLRHSVVDGVQLDLFELTGSTDVNNAKRRLEECERLSGKENHYPILICTAAGEVGLDMEWASTLVHWDLNPNPQRMEQRTWRLDRRISSDSTRRHYSVIHMICDDIPHHETLEETINTRYEQAAESLGLSERSYIPEGADEIEIHPGGSAHSPHLMDDELNHLDVMFHGGEDQNHWPGPRLKEAERLRCAAISEYCVSEQFLRSSETILQNGHVSETEPWPSRLALGEPRVRNVRDLEMVSPAFSRKVSPKIPNHEHALTYACSWEQLLPDTHLLPNLSQVPKVLFSRVLGECGNGGGLVHVFIDLPIDKCVLAINKEISSLNNGGGSNFHDRGMRILSPEGNLLFTSEREGIERQAWAIVFQTMKLLLSQEEINIAEPYTNELEDQIGRQEVTQRIDDLLRRNQEKTRERLAVQNKIEECGDEHEGHNRRLARIEGLSEDIAQRQEQIEILTGFSHILTPIAIVERLK